MDTERVNSERRNRFYLFGKRGKKKHCIALLLQGMRSPAKQNTAKTGTTT